MRVDETQDAIAHILRQLNGYSTHFRSPSSETEVWLSLANEGRDAFVKLLADLGAKLTLAVNVQTSARLTRQP
jgi:hypothetical protein